jgi:transcriptional regulator with XRE-family HTH domain
VTAKPKYKEFVRIARKRIDYWRQVAVRDFTEDLLYRLQQKKLSQARLADKLGVRPAYISRILRGTDNLTLETMVKVAMAVGGKLRIHIADQEAATNFQDVFTADSEYPVTFEEIGPRNSATRRNAFSFTRNASGKPSCLPFTEHEGG